MSDLVNARGVCNDRLPDVGTSPPDNRLDGVMSQHFEIPRLRVLARHALPHVIESTIIPLALFLLFLKVVGV